MAMISSIQLLRFVAASLIVLNHSIKEFSGSQTFGEFGVDIFFVISGFVISHITQGENEHFFTRRLVRIVPLYGLFTLAIAAIAYVAPHFLRTVKWDVYHFVASLLFIPWWTESLKFSPILPMGWTLNYEIWFYLLFYVAVQISVGYREIVCSLLIVCVYAITSLLPLDDTATLAFYSNSIVLEFIFGMAISVLYRSKKTVFESLPRPVVLSIAIAAPVAFYYTTYVSNLDLPRCVYWGLPACGCVLVCLSSEGHFNQFPRRMISAVLVAGEISYPLYLIHMFLIAGISRVAGISNLSILPGFVLALLLSSVASFVVSECFDKPTRRVLRAALLNRSAPA